MKICSKCRLEKEITEFNQNKTKKDGLSYWCKTCYKDYCIKNKERIIKQSQEYRSQHKEQIKEYFAQPEIKERCKKWRQDYYIKHKKRRKEYLVKNKEHRKQQAREYRINNKDKIKAHNMRPEIKQRNYERLKRRRSIPGNYLFHHLGCGLRTWCKDSGSHKNCRTHELVKMTKDEFKIYFESKFTKGMTWEKVFNGEIHIDHIRPLNSFNANNPEDVEDAWHWSNLQPLWAEDNWSKRDYFPPQIYWSIY